MTTHSPDPVAYVEVNRPTRVRVIEGLMANTEGYIANKGETLSWVIVEDSKKGLTPHLHVNSNLEEIDVKEDINMMIKETVVTPEEVLEAYRETGLIPTDDIPYEVVDGKAYGCAIGALYLKEYGEPSEGDSQIPYLKYADKLFSGNSLAFGAGFDTGYEGTSFESYLPNYGKDEADEIRKLGYECGRKVKEEIC